MSESRPEKRFPIMGNGAVGEKSVSRIEGRKSLRTGLEAVRETESLVCEDLFLLRSLQGMGEERGEGEFFRNAFGGPSRKIVLGNPRKLAARQIGTALTGRRTAAFLESDRLAEISDLLYAIPGRHIPLLLHAPCKTLDRHARAPGGAHESYHHLADTGFFLILARNAQAAADFTLVARRTAESSLIPGLIAQDGPETAFAPQDLYLPDHKLVRQYLSSALSLEASPTPAQRQIFGDERPLLPRWFNLDRPIAQGVAQGGEEFALGRVGQSVFFNRHLEAIAEASLREYETLTGRSYAFISAWRIAGARHFFVAQGSAVETAEAVSDYLRETKGWKIGVVGINWLRPFPLEAVKKALRKARGVTVLERLETPLGSDPPLMRELRAALPHPVPVLISATYGLGGQPFTAAQLAAAAENMRAGDNLKERLHLGIAPPSVRSDFPKRERVLQTVQRDYGLIEAITLKEQERVDCRPGNTFSLSLHAPESELPENWLKAFAEAFGETFGPRLRSRFSIPFRGCWIGRLSAGPDLLRDPGDDHPVNLALLKGLYFPSFLNPFEAVVKGGRVVIATAMPPESVWAQLPERWRFTAQERDLVLFAVGEDWKDLLAAVSSLVEEKEALGSKIPCARLPSEPGPKRRRELPSVIRRRQKTVGTYDNVPRFFGEIVQPRLEGERPQSVPEPLLTLGTMPLNPVGSRNTASENRDLPEIGMADCSGCGKCWTVCPDSALGPVAIGMEALLEAAADRIVSSPPAADKIRRAFRQLGGRINSLMRKSGARELTHETMEEAFAWLAQKMGVEASDLPACKGFFSALEKEMNHLSFGVKEAFFHDPYKENKTSGRLLALALNPNTCLGCGICAAVCPENAIEMVPRGPENTAAAGRGWDFWEALPDTPAKVVSRVGKVPEIGPLAGLLMARRNRVTMEGGEGVEAGSGERIALRQICAVVANHVEGQTRENVSRLEDLSKRLRGRIQERITGAFPVEDLSALEKAFAKEKSGKANLGAVLAHLEEAGNASTVERGELRKLLRVCREVENLIWKLTEGEQGVGRSRFALVVASKTLADWALAFPANPFEVAVVADLKADGVASGLVEGLLSETLEQYRLIRRSELLLRAPPNLVQEEKDLDNLTLRDLPEAEVLSCPSVLVLSDAETGWTLAERCCGNFVPLKTIIFDELGLSAGNENPGLLALGRRDAYLLSTSIAHPNHLFEGVRAALQTPAPALLHVYSPSPGRHGFPARETISRAEAAVAGGVQPLFSYNPRGAGLFGTRMKLEGNSGRDEKRVLESARWALGQERFQSFFSPAGDSGGAPPSLPMADWLDLEPSHRREQTPLLTDSSGRPWRVHRDLIQALEIKAENWAVLKEITGLENPFTANLKAQLEEELKAGHKSELEDLAASYEKKLLKLHENQRTLQATFLKKRIRVLLDRKVAGKREILAATKES